MSGGEYGFAHERVREFAERMATVGECSCASPEYREGFRDLLMKVAAAMRAIEWNDSGDGDNGEEPLLRALVPETPSDMEVVRARVALVDDEGRCHVQSAWAYAGVVRLPEARVGDVGRAWVRGGRVVGFEKLYDDEEGAKR